MDGITKIIDSSLEIRRALSVKMINNGYSYFQINELLNVSQSFVEKWRALYNKKGAICFATNYKGSKSYLREDQKQKVYEFIKSKPSCQLEILICYIKDKFDIEYKSKQSYYDLFDHAGLSWKKTEKVNPKKDEEKVAAKKKEIKKNSTTEKKKFCPGNWS
jgi:putative transposase